MSGDRRAVVVLVSTILLVAVGLAATIVLALVWSGNRHESQISVLPSPPPEVTISAAQPTFDDETRASVVPSSQPSLPASPAASQAVGAQTPELPTPIPTESVPPPLTASEITAGIASPTASATESPTLVPVLQSALAWHRSTVPSDNELEVTVAQMALRDKVAQMLMVGFHGRSVASSPELSTMVEGYHVGGLVLLEANAHDPQQIRQMIMELQRLASSSGAGIPLFVSINHEGGIVVRITEGVTGFPGNMAVAATNRPDNAFDAAAVAALELRAMGINMNLAPVLDVNDNPLNPIIGTRSFGDSPELAAEYGRLTIRGFQQAGIISVAKHFPGHGGVEVDSHGALPLIESSADELAEHELVPFQAAIDEGVEAIMTAHISIPALDSTGRPATLSPEILTGLLRQKMGFDGLIMTDSLGMAGVTAGRGQVGAALEAVQAGADILLSTAPMDKHIAIIDAVQDAVERGDIPMERINRSVVRILRVKHAYGLFDNEPTLDLGIVGSEEHQALADEIALQAVTLLQDADGFVPLPPPPQRLLLVSPRQLPRVPSGERTTFARLLRQRGYDVTEMTFDLGSQQSRTDVYAGATAQAGSYDAIIFGEWELIKRYVNWSQTWQERLLDDLQKQNSHLIIVAWHNPTAILRCPQGASFLTAYGPTDAQVSAVTAILVGDRAPTGDLPLSLP